MHKNDDNMGLGIVSVPLEPTTEMINAGAAVCVDRLPDAAFGLDGDELLARDVYRQMIAHFSRNCR